MKNQEKTYSETIAEIEAIIAKIESEDPNIDEIDNYIKKATELINICKEKICKTEKKIENIMENTD